MRNLRIVGRSLLRFSGDNPLPLTATAWDSASNSIICAFGPSESRAVIELKRVHQGQSQADDRLDSVSSWDAPCPLPTLTCDQILNLHHFSDTATTCLVLAGGDIVLVRESPLPSEEAVEIVGSVDAGISAASWSPDEELLAITTQADTLLFMTRDIENVSSINFTSNDVNVSNHVSVGWGKKETQFQGKRAKALRDPTVPEHVDEGVLSPFDDQTVAISWRGDGAYVAVNKIEQEKRRMIRVYSREGELNSVSEPVDGLEGALSWRPSGNLITSIQRKNEQIQVVFFERNGLRHGQFNLRFTPDEFSALSTPLDLSWNSDSNVLAVQYPTKVQLWTMSNYHYYLKQELTFSEQQTPSVMCDWHSERPLSLALATTSSLQILDYTSSMAIGSTSSPDDYGIVASIDGLNLKITPLRVANIPPPMSLHRLTLEDKAIDAAISSSGSRLAVLSDNGVACYSLDKRKRFVPELTWRNSMFQDSCPRHVTFVGDEMIYVLTDHWEGDSSLWMIEGDSINNLGPLDGKGRISSLITDIDYQKAHLQFSDGSLYEIQYDANAPFIVSNLVTKFPSLSPETRTMARDRASISFGLTKNGALYANDRALVRNCTSFLVTPAHLIFTTTQHFLKFVHLTNVDNLEIPPDEPQKDERCRIVERGARLVTAMPTTYTVVLQMPRGNLETIYPRAMVLAAVRKSIEIEQYGEAFLTCRSQRVDMNILHDHAPERFMQSINKIIEQIKKVEYIDLLLSQLRDEDVSQSMYKETIKKSLPNGTTSTPPDLPTPVSVAPGSKVNKICDAFLSALQQSQYCDAHLQNIITAHVCKVPADLEAGLEMIGQLQSSASPLTEKAAEHICFLADVNQLYDTSLGIYNLELALLIAQQSQKDPREYLPHLQSLHDLPDIRRKFKIDDQLNRKWKALTHLVSLEAHYEIKEYVLKHNLYTEALKAYQYDEPHLREIMRLYAQHLSSTNRHKDAGIAYEYLQDHISAYQSYHSANLWRETLTCATLANLSSPELTELATTLAEGLAESKDYLSAAIIQTDYLHNIPLAATLLCKGNHPTEALRLAILHNQPNLLPTVIDDALAEASGSMTEFLAECKTQLLHQVPRLLELRAKKLEDPLAFLGGDIDSDTANMNIPDNISLAPTDTTGGNTFMTRYTGRSGTINTQTTRKTSKNKRREERKRARGKKGSVYEEEYLVNSVERLVARINGMNEEVQRLVEGLTKRGMRERADAVTRAMRDVVERCEAAVAEMYPETVTAGEKLGVGSGNAAGTAVATAEEGWKPTPPDAVFLASIEETSRKREPPLVRKFERLSLLG